MTIDKNEVLNIVSCILGEDCEGIYAPRTWVDYGSDDGDFFTTKNFDFKIEETDEIELSKGCTKLVIMPKYKDYVIKMLITDIIDEDYDEDYHLILDNTVCNSIANEIGVYDDASDTLQDSLIPNVYIGEYCGMEVYVQERIKESYCQRYPHYVEDTLIKGLSQKETTQITHTMDSANNDEIQILFVKDMIDYYGEEETINILSEIKEFGIDDLHGNNYGYTYDDKPVFFDYGGYSSDMYCSI
jgi:hypothetical protein